ncbi:TIGR04063 family PEP-CTERM/XrtA system glycosyltransferase [Massilia litorea]|uniref:Glycosyltransferase, exosortase A system-associated n=1 Tax=Massilia litorea TaxID=2769491 RepID=A0A7L9U7F6_9BURK|nr:TIGR04063 family PEP-CTERM/XrtA system glycosyltransferase [Massilia litorea]QOL50954.1 glycosyltransferase, exosortase A system-associated [Massilia litorea]
MRVLHVLDHSIPLHSGYTFRTASILREQRALGWETFHVTGSKHQGAKDLAEETADGLHFYRTAKSRGAFAKLPILNQLEVINGLERRLSEIIPQIKPDVLHAHSPCLNGIAAIRAGRKFGIPVVYEVRAFWEDAAVDHGTSTENGLRYKMTRALETHALKRADAVTTICEGLRRDIVERGIPASKVTVIPNAVDIDKFAVGGEADQDLKRQLGLAGHRLIGFIGSFYAYEGLDVLLRAVPALSARAPDLRVLLVGGGPQDANLRQLAKDLGIADKVVFTGRVPHDQVQKYYDLLDVLVYPRLSMRLTDLVTPLKPLEAMAQGRILAASSVGGHRELIADGKTGILFAPDDPAALASKVGELLDAQSTWPALRLAGRAYVETERNWPVSVARYKNIYGQLTGSKLKAA